MNPTLRDLLRLFCLSLVVRIVLAVFVRYPGYMDAAYYAVGAIRLAQGGGLSEPFLWNYLDDPWGLPHPGFLYWMPLPSLLAAPFAALFPGSFFALQFPFVLISALLPLVAYGVAWDVAGEQRKRGRAWLAALLALFSGFFFPYWNLPETFAPFALLGGVALWMAGRWRVGSGRPMLDAGHWLLVGLLVGLAHLTRADGILLLPVVAAAPFVPPDSNSKRRATRVVIRYWSALALGYLLVMVPWFVRNLSTVGTVLSPAGTKVLWLTNYDDLFCYGCDLSFHSYLAWGWGNILNSKLSALWINFQRLLAEDCQIFWLPFVLLGLYRLRRSTTLVISTLYLFGLYLAHSLLFTFPGWRGGFFHSGGAVLSFLYVAGVEGLEAAVGWAARQRRWRLRQARTVFTVATVVAAVILSGYAAALKLPAWWDADAVYREVGAWLTANGVPAETVIMVGNPPGFYYHAHVPSVVVPNGGVDTLLDVCQRYGVRYLVLDSNHPALLKALYEGGVVSPHLLPVATLAEDRVRVWKVAW